MSSREMWEPPSEAWTLEPGDPGTPLLAVHSDRDASEQPEASRSDVDKVNGRSAWLPEGIDPVWGDVRHHRQRIVQLKWWVTYWKARAEEAERRERHLRERLP